MLRACITIVVQAFLFSICRFKCKYCGKTFTFSNFGNYARAVEIYGIAKNVLFKAIIYLKELYINNFLE